MAMTRTQRRALDEIFRLLREHPERWSFSKYEATLKKEDSPLNAEATIWLANRYYATWFTLGGISYDSFRPAWFFFPWEWWRVRLIRAAEEAQGKMIWR